MGACYPRSTEKRRSKMSSHPQDVRQVVRAYRRSKEKWPATTDEMASWAIREGLWEPNRKQRIRQCAGEIARALREEYYTDSNGRRVRTKHPVRVRRWGGGQTSLWDDIRNAPREHMKMSFQQRRARIVGDCRQLKTDVDSYNDSHLGDDLIQLVLDFTKDIAELEASYTATAAAA